MRPEMILYFPDGGNITVVSFPLNFHFKIATRVFNRRKFCTSFNKHQGRKQEFILAGAFSHRPIFPSLPCFPFSFPSLLLLSFLLRCSSLLSGPLNPGRGLGVRCKLSHQGPRRGLIKCRVDYIEQRTRLVELCLVAANVVLFLSK